MADETIENAPIKEQVSSALPFSHSDRDVIERQLNVSSIRTSSLESMIDVYEIEKTVQIIVKHGYKNIALQFPDVLLPDASAVAKLLEQKTNEKVFILADTSYGSCCVDEVAAEHVKADVIIHYGRACLSLTRRLPVYYVFGKFSVDVTKCLQHFNDLFKDKNSRIILMHDVVYAHCIEKLQEQLQPAYKNLIVSQIESKLLQNVISLSHSNTENSEIERENENGNANRQEKELDGSELEHFHIEKDTDGREGNKIMKRFGFEFSLPSGHEVEEYQVLYIGQENLNLTNLMMTYNKCQFYTYDPATNKSRKETLNVNRALMKRYYMIQKAKDAQVVGIAVGTLGVADYLEVIERLKKVLSSAGKKYYTFVMGKLNVPKMANFMEIDVFVLVACPENTLIDSQEFYKPIVTPYEMEIACLRTQEWTGEYITDFRQLLPGASHSVDLEDKANFDEDDDFPEVSLISGDLRPNYKTINDDKESQSTSLVQRNQETTLSTQRHTSAAEFLVTRSWRGLEQNLGETAVSEAKEGRMGIASGYTHEKDEDS